MMPSMGSRDVLLVQEVLIFLEPNGAPQAHLIPVNLTEAPQTVIIALSQQAPYVVAQAG